MEECALSDAIRNGLARKLPIGDSCGYNTLVEILHSESGVSFSHYIGGQLDTQVFPVARQAYPGARFSHATRAQATVVSGGVPICGGIWIRIMLFLIAYTTKSRIE